MEFLDSLIMQSGVEMACSFSFVPSVNVSVLFFKKKVFLFFIRFYCRIIKILLSLLPKKIETLCKRKSSVLPVILDSVS
jgi:hypothetical protein